MKRLLFLTVLCTGIAMFLAGPVCAKVTGTCVNCHTMHNSQNGSHMLFNTTIDGESSGTHGGGYPSLTRGSCVGCHTGTNTSTSTRPFVYDATAIPSYGTDTLAGGNFYWVAQPGGSAKGHNVKGIPGMTADSVLTVAPGHEGTGCTTGCHGTLFATTVPVLNTGCQGCHLVPKHHAPPQADGTPALAVNGWFRFLSGHNYTNGVEGIEDDDWQYTKDASDHNEYLGKVGTHTDAGFAGGFLNIQENTMTAYCTGCHGNFHTQADGNANWIRHPSDAVIPNSGEYSAYTVYDPIAPVARPDLSTIGDTGKVRPATDMVMCLSCHRAHGSPYNDMLRWDYEAGTIAGGGGTSDNTGCFVCHTEKDN